MLLFSHPTGNQNSRAVLNALVETQLLYQFHTSFATFEGTALHLLTQMGILQELNRRQFATSLKKYIHTYPRLEFRSRIGQKLKFFQRSMYEVSQRMDQKITNRISRLENESISGIYAYEDMSKEQFDHAKTKDWQCFYDLPIGYWRAHHQLLTEEQEKHPEWSRTLTGFDSSLEKLARKDQELRLADQIFVASQFTANTLRYFPEKLNAPIHIIPYGFPEVTQATKERTYNFHQSNRPLKLLFVGGLSQRKGLSYLFEAVEHFGKAVELTVVGRKKREDCKPLNRALEKCNWIPYLPHSEILALMRNSDLLLFPSLFEGFGLVITEAMSQGTPVLATERTAAPDIITDGVDGFLVKAGSSEDIITKIQSIFSQPQKLEEMGRMVLQTAQQRPWKQYGLELVERLNEILEKASVQI